MERRKAEAEDLDLSAFAFAQVKAKKIEADEKLRERCKDCPGPDVAGGCADRPAVSWGGRVFQVCPRGMLRSAFWGASMDIYAASLISPLAGWDDAFAPKAVEACIEFRTAQQRDIEERARERAAQRHDVPEFGGQRSAREV